VKKRGFNKMKQKKVLVTGGAGFIGSHIVDALIERDYNVVVVDNLSSGKIENVNKKARFYKMDIKSRQLEQVFRKEKPQIVSHQAAQKNVRLSVENPAFYLEDNGIGTINLLENCVKHKAEKVVFASTGGALYDSTLLPAKEDSKINPLSPYGITKLLCELYLKFYNETYGLRFTSLRYSNVYGPRQDFEGEAGVIAIFANSILKEKIPIIFGDGNQTRDFVYVDDVVRANIESIENPKADNKIFNISACRETSVNQVFLMLKKITGYEGKAIHAKPKKGEIRRIFLSYNRAYKIIGWKPSVSLEQGLEKTVEWYRKNERANI
jgi:UDP-glucose 4-epimerase